MTVLRIISESELQKHHSWRSDAPEAFPEDFKTLLWNLGCDTIQGIETQMNTHRNLFGEVVTCRRWVCFERSDKEWLQSGYCTREALNEYSGSSLLADLTGVRRRREVLNDTEIEVLDESYKDTEEDL